MKKIQILGTGCPKCKTLMANAEAAVKAARRYFGLTPNGVVGPLLWYAIAEYYYYNV